MDKQYLEVRVKTLEIELQTLRSRLNQLEQNTVTPTPTNVLGQVGKLIIIDETHSSYTMACDEVSRWLENCEIICGSVDLLYAKYCDYHSTIILSHDLFNPEIYKAGYRKISVNGRWQWTKERG